MKPYNSFRTWILKTQVDQDTAIGDLARRIDRDPNFPKNGHRKQYHINYMLQHWSDLGFEGNGFHGLMDEAWEKYLKAVVSCYNCPQSSEYLAYRELLESEGFNFVYEKYESELPRGMREYLQEQRQARA